MRVVFFNSVFGGVSPVFRIFWKVSCFGEGSEELSNFFFSSCSWFDL